MPANARTKSARHPNRRLRRPLTLLLCVAMILPILAALARPTPQPPAASTFAPLESWRLAVLSGDPAKLKSLYSTSPEPTIADIKNNPKSLQDEVAFWTAWKAKGLSGLNLEILQQQDPARDQHTVVFRAALGLRDGATSKHEYILLVQGWSKEGDRWLLTTTRRSDAAGLRQPIENKEIYPVAADVNKEISDAVQSTEKSHKRLLLVFGGNWCYDCHVLDEAFHSPEIAPTLNKYFEVRHIDVGQMDKNLDVAKQYDIPLERGVPAIAVLDSDGKLLFSQKRGEFEAARSMANEDILAFLNKWKPTKVL